MAKVTSTKRTKRANGEGGIFKDGATGRYRVMVSTNDPEHPRLTARAADHDSAVKKLREFQAMVGTGVPLGSSATAAQLANEWLEVQEDKVVSGDKDWKTVDQYRWALDAAVEHLGDKQLRSLTAQDVRSALRQMAHDGASKASVVRVRSVLGQALDFAMANDLVGRNVARLAELPATPPAKPKRSLTEEQLARVWEVSRAYPLQHAFLVTASQLGLRPGELLGLRWADVDFEGHTLAVTGMIDRGGQQRGGGKMRRVPRTKVNSDRRIAMPPETEAALLAWAAEQAEQASKAGKAWSDLGLVFTSEVGTIINPSNMDRRLAKVTQAVGLEGRWSMTELGRKTAASVLSAHGMRLEDIADQFGHKNTRMVQEHYRHQLRANDSHLDVWAKLGAPVPGE